MGCICYFWANCANSTSAESAWIGPACPAPGGRTRGPTPRTEANSAASATSSRIAKASLSALPEDVELRSTEAHRRVVRRACELMMSRLDEPLSMLQGCNRIGESQRKLNYYF